MNKNYNHSLLENLTNQFSQKKPNVRENVLRYGIECASTYELLMLLLGCGTAKNPVQKLAKTAVRAIISNPDGNVADFLQQIDGIGQTKAIIVAAALELGRRFANPHGQFINYPGDVLPFVRHYSLEPKEYFLSILLNGAHAIQKIAVVGVGTVNRCIVDPREVFHDAIEARSAAIIICHNHPSGTPEPSCEDIHLTERISKAGSIIGIPLLDHIIITRDDYYSFLENETLPKNP